MADTRTFRNYAESLPVGPSQYLVGVDNRRVPSASKGIPEGGETGQVLSKQSDENYDATWRFLGTAAEKDLEYFVGTADAASTDSLKGSSLIGFKRPEDGAIEETVRKKLLETVSLQSFGPVGDGVSDDTLAVLKAWQSAAVGKGGIYVAPFGYNKTPGAFPISENWVKPTYMRFTKATRLALFDGSPAEPNDIDDDPVFWTQKHTKVDNGTDQNAQSPSVVHDVIVYGSGLTGSIDTDATWIALLGNAVGLGENVGSEESPDYDLRGALIGVTGFARSEKPAGITTALWGYASTPVMNQTEFDALSGMSYPSVGCEVNIDIRTPDAGYKTGFGGKGVTAGYLGYNYRPAGQGVRDWSFGFILSGSPNDANFGSQDVDNWSGFYVGARFDFIKRHGIEFGRYFKTDSYGIRFPDTYAGTQAPAAAIHLGGSKLQMGQYTGSDFRDRDLWHNGGALWFRYGGINRSVLQEANGIIDVTKTGSSVEFRLRGIHSVAPAIAMQRATNSDGSPAAVVNGDRLGAIFFGGYGASGYFNNATIESFAAETWTDSARGQSLLFSTTAAGGSTRTTRLTIDDKGNTVIGTGALSTTATDGFFYGSSSAGPPTGTPSTKSGRVPFHFDTTNSRLYAYIGGSWKSATLS